jgi:DNA-directed RNA polymerase specialized sigma24 family protein
VPSDIETPELQGVRASPREEAELDERRDQVDRLQGDKLLLEELSAEGYVGRKYTVFATVLAKYGVAVIRGWIRQGVILAKVRERGFGGLPPEPHRRALNEDEDTAEELANETVALALVAFRDKVLVPGRWDASRGASLSTFFVGQCLMQFGNVYRRWRTEYVSRPEAVEPESDVFHSTVEDVAHQSAIKDEARRVLSLVKDPRAREAFWRHAVNGEPFPVIAGRLGMTEKAVEKMIARARKQVREEGAA